MKQEIDDLKFELSLRTQKISDSNLNKQLETAEKEDCESIYHEKQEEQAKQIQDLNSKIEMLTELIKTKIDSKDAEMSQLNKELYEEIEMLKQKIAENDEEVKEKEDSDSFEELNAEPKENNAYLMENGQICEIREEEGEIEVIQRQRSKEREDFILWIGKKQLCGVLKDSKWTLSLYLGENKLNSVEITGNIQKSDRFIQKGNRIYIGVYSPYELYRLTVRGEAMKVESFGNIGGNLYSICEHEDEFYVGLYNKPVTKIKQGKITTIPEIGTYTGQMKIENNCLYSSDAYGKVIKYNLETNKVEKTVNVGNYYALLIGDKIARSTNNKLSIYDWGEFKLKEIGFSKSGYLFLLKQTQKYSVLAYQTCLLIINHSTLETKEYETGTIPKRYLNYN